MRPISIRSDYESGGQEFEFSSGAPSIPKLSHYIQNVIALSAQLGHCSRHNTSNKTSNTFRKAMPDFLTRRCGAWHFVRRVPTEFAHLDVRGIIKHSTKVRIAQDRTGRRAARVASKLNDELELYWKSLADDRSEASLSRYDEARRRARSLGFEYVENAQLLMLPPEQRLDRIETLVARGATNDSAARAALLGTVKRPGFPCPSCLKNMKR
jgi:hypothetical protein